MILKQLVRFITINDVSNSMRPCCYHHTTNELFPLCDNVRAHYASGDIATYEEGIALEKPNNKTSSNGSYQNNDYKFLCLVGGGTTAPTVEDRQLENLYGTAQLEQNTGSTSYKDMKMNVITTYTNKTDSNLTINEIGLGFVNQHHAIGATAYDTSYVIGGAALLTREVLSTPIVLASGESRTFAITIDFLDMLTQ